MGICDCRKRTGLFCYKHRVSVCPNCILPSHSTCVIKTYVQWLQDSSFQPLSCNLCQQPITATSSIRLSCLDVFHTNCLDKYCSNLPAHTTQAGYICPICSKPIIPSADNQNAITNAINEYLSLALWFKKFSTINSDVKKNEIENNNSNNNLIVNLNSNNPNTNTSTGIYLYSRKALQREINSNNSNLINDDQNDNNLNNTSILNDSNQFYDDDDKYNKKPTITETPRKIETIKKSSISKPNRKNSLITIRCIVWSFLAFSIFITFLFFYFSF
eukprot:TRINITY_DN917_c2_g1_i1.p1 TRINITY_DN917_c2_g1~~TRINITY_DN917_c2_g1_i1.p1  ORF type:complete len:273 (+),score=107.90 TRINITY_DN917_c2_g1_i1:87-905(+)